MIISRTRHWFVRGTCMGRGQGGQAGTERMVVNLSPFRSICWVFVVGGMGRREAEMWCTGGLLASPRAFSAFSRVWVLESYYFIF